jgi:Tfp pilus assembly protein PilP
VTLVVCACVAAVAVGATPLLMAQPKLPVPAPAAPTSADDPAATGTRRDPFVRPAVEDSDAVPLPTIAPRPEGLAGLSIQEIAVRGVLVAHGRSVGFIQGPDRKHYVVRAGDRLRDGVVDTVIPDAVVVLADQGSGNAGGPGPAARRSLRVRPEER